MLIESHTPSSESILQTYNLIDYIVEHDPDFQKGRSLQALRTLSNLIYPALAAGKKRQYLAKADFIRVNRYGLTWRTFRKHAETFIAKGYSFGLQLYFHKRSTLGKLTNSLRQTAKAAKAVSKGLGNNLQTTVANLLSPCKETKLRCKTAPTLEERFINIRAKLTTEPTSQAEIAKDVAILTDWLARNTVSGFSPIIEQAENLLKSNIALLRLFNKHA